MILADHEITELCLTSAMVMPYDHNNVNPCSYDLTLGQNYIVDRDLSKDFPEVRSFDGSRYALPPGGFMLCEVSETIVMPKNIVGKIALKSSAARMGLGHLMAGFVDSGYEGRLTLEICNHSRCRTIEIFAGMKMVQIVFHKMNSVPHRCYGETGRYQHDSRVMPSKKKY